MTTAELIYEMAERFEKCKNTAKERNERYTGGNDALSGFMNPEHAGVAKAEIGLMTTVCHKVSRIGALLNNPDMDPGKESLQDSILDAINYLMFVWIITERVSGELTGDDWKWLVEFAHVGCAGYGDTFLREGYTDEEITKAKCRILELLRKETKCQSRM